MRNLERTALVALAMCLPAGVFGACGHSVGVDFCGPDLLRLIYINASGLVYVRPTGPLVPLPSGFVCTPVSGVYFVLNPNAANFQQIYSALLSARVEGATVTLVADPAQPTCTIMYVTL